MKRAVTGGAHRGPAALRRRRRTVRFVQAILVLLSGGLIALAGYSFGRVQGYDAARRAVDFDAPRPPSNVQTVVLVVLGGLTIGAAFLLDDPRGGVRLPSPARLDDLAGRAEAAAVERAERYASDDPAG